MSIRSNTLYNLLGSIIPLAVSLITIPLYIGLIGEGRYGVLAIVWLLLGYFGLFDLGLGRATAQLIAARRDLPAQQRAQVFWTSLIMNIGLGVVGGLIAWPIAAYLFENFFKIEALLRPELQHAVPWLALAVPMAILTGTLSGTLQGCERFYELNLISVSGTVLFQLLPLAVAKYLSTDLAVLLPSVLLARLLTTLALFQRSIRHVALGYKPSFHRAQAGQLLRFGGWVTITSFVGPMMVILDRFIIGGLLGAKAVTYYTVPFQLADRTRMIPGALTTALFPRFSAATAVEEKRLADESLKVLVVLMTPIIMTCIIFIKPFLTWWVGQEFADQSTLIGQVLLLGFWINGLSAIPYAQLQARGKPGLVAKCHLFEIFPYFLLLYMGLTQLGLIGAAAAFSIRGLIDFILLASFAGGVWKALGLFIIPFLLFAVALLITFQSTGNNFLWLAYVMTLFLITMTWSCCKAPDSISISVKEKLKQFFNKLVNIDSK